MDIRVELVEKIPDDLIKDFWDVFNESFTELDSSGDAIERQLFYTEEELKEIAQDKDYAKCVAFDGDKIVGFIIGTNKLAKMAKTTYINPTFITNKYPKEVEEERFFFCSIIGVLPEYQKKGTGLLILQKVIDMGDDGKEYKVMFDVCDKNRFLGPVVKSVLESKGYDTDLEEVDHQTYFLSSLQKKLKEPVA